MLLRDLAKIMWVRICVSYPFDPWFILDRDLEILREEVTKDDFDWARVHNFKPEIKSIFERNGRNPEYGVRWSLHFDYFTD